MMAFIIGGSGSGKSVYAENFVTLISEKTEKQNHTYCPKYYLATMQASDDESRKRIVRHQAQRCLKGFQTIEQPTAIQDALAHMEAGEKSALLECISNLTANEMFATSVPETEETVVNRIVGGISSLKKELTHLVVVGNNVFEDGRVYDETTMAYLWAMGRIHTRLAAMADKVVEVVAGIPVIIKDEQGEFDF